MSEPEHHLTDASCADLVLGLTPIAASDALLAHAERCPECETRLRAHAGASIRARAESGALADAAAGDDAVKRGMMPLELRPLRSRPRWQDGAIVAAAAAVLLALVIPRMSPPTRALESSEWLQSPGEMVRTRADGAVDPRLAEGFEAYARRDLPGAVRALRAASAEGAAEQARRLYLGHALLASGESVEALSWLASLDLARLPEPWRSEAEAALAAAWRANGRRAPMVPAQGTAPR